MIMNLMVMCPFPLISFSLPMCSACYALRSIKAVVTRETLRMIYFAQIHSLLSYGIILWGNSSYAQKVFTIQK
jgi:hypothetical protein